MQNSSVCKNREAGKEGHLYDAKHCSCIFRPCDVSGCLALIKSLCVSLPISQDVGFVCVSSSSGKPDALLQGKEEKECQRESVGSETDITLTVTFNYLNKFLWVFFVHLCVRFLKLLGLIKNPDKQ